MPKGTIPAKDNTLLSFATTLSTALTAAPIPLACTAEMATQLASLLTSFSTKLSAAQNPLTRGHSTIFSKDEAKELLVNYLRVVIRQIQGASTVSDQQRTDLGLPVRHTPTHPANPGTAYKFNASLTTQGYLDFSWKCANPTGGTVYQVFRKIGDAEPVYLGGAGQKKFTDMTLPAGTSQMTYMIQAVRSTAVGDWASFNVNIGVTAGGTMTAAVKETPVKIAA